MYLIKCVHIAIIQEMMFLAERTIKDTTASCRCKGQRRPSLIFMLGKSPIWPSSTYKQTESDRRTNRRIGRLPIFALSRPRNLRRSFFFPLCPVPSSLTSPMVIPARRASETRLNSFRFTSSFRFFRQIFTDLGFFAWRRPRNGRFLFSSVERLCTSTDFRRCLRMYRITCRPKQNQQTCPRCVIVYSSPSEVY